MDNIPEYELKIDEAAAAPTVDTPPCETPSDEGGRNKRKADEISNTNDSANNGDNSSANNGSANSVADSEASAEYVKPYFIDWRYLTPEVLEECVTFSKPMVVKMGCTFVWVNFNFNKFMKMHPEVDVAPRKTRLYFKQPYLKTPFGYSPKTGDDGKISNNLRLLFSEFLDDEGREFYERCKEIDEWIIKKCFENADKWPLKLKLAKGDVLTTASVRGRYIPICRDSCDEEGNPKPEYGQYQSQKFITQKEDKKKGIEEDPYKAFCTIWDCNKELETEVLTRENAVPTDKELKENPEIGNERNTVIEKNDYCQTISQWSRIFLNATGFGPTFNPEEILHIRESDIMEIKRPSKKICSFHV